MAGHIWLEELIEGHWPVVMKTQFNGNQVTTAMEVWDAYSKNVLSVSQINPVFVFKGSRVASLL